MDDHKKKQNLQELPFKPPFFYGWMIVGISALTLFFSGPGQTYSVFAFIDSYIGEFGWSRSLVSSMYSMGTLTAGLIIGIMGNKFDRYGHRIMTTIVAISLGLACLEMSFVKNLGMLFLGFFLIRLLGQGSMSLSSSTLVPQWFDAKKGRALSIASLGGAFAWAILPPLNTWLIQTYGWRFGWRFWSALLWCIMTPAAFIVIRDRAEDVGLWPDNQKYSNQPTLLAHNIEANPLYEVWTVKETIRTRSFWLLLFCMSIPSAIATGLIFHQVSVMEKVGLPPQVAALVLSIMAMVSFPMMLVSGPVADKVPGRFLMAFSQGLLLVSMIILLKANSTLLAMVYGVLMGILMALLSIVGSVIWADYFGRRYLSSIRGIAMMAGVIGSALGPLPFGFAYDLFGSYQQIIVITLIFPALGVISALLATPPEKNERS